MTQEGKTKLFSFCFHTCTVQKTVSELEPGSERDRTWNVHHPHTVSSTTKEEKYEVISSKTLVR
jgi:hypothetical protein